VWSKYDFWGMAPFDKNFKNWCKGALIEAPVVWLLGARSWRICVGGASSRPRAVAREPADLDATAWGNTPRYHPGWVYHGLLVGPPGVAALFLHRLLAGHFLPHDLLTAMHQAHAVGGVFPRASLDKCRLRARTWLDRACRRAIT